MGEPFQLGRYSLHAELASGGMATVYLARLNGPVGFGRTVAIKRLHPHLARDPNFVAMFLDEARLAARVQHPNVVTTLDVVASDRELFLVMDYIRGESLGLLTRLVKKSKATIPIPIAARILIDMLMGLHAAHEATNEKGEPLGIVHRDVSPQNVIVGADGVSRVLDFGVAKAASRLQTTREGQLKGKIPYMPPEQLNGEVSQRTDVYAAGVVIWETLTCTRLFKGETEAQVLHMIMTAPIPQPSSVNPEVPGPLDRVVLKALQKNPNDRYQTARELAEAIDACVRPASTMQVAEWLEKTAASSLAMRNKVVAEIESGASTPDKPLMEMLEEASRPSRDIPSLQAEVLSSPSVASHTVQSQPNTPPSSGTWKLAGAIAALALVIGLVAIAFKVGRSQSVPVQSAPIASTPAAAIAPPPSTSTPAIASTPANASASTPAIASASAARPAIVKAPTTVKTSTRPHPSTANTDDINGLIDSRR